MAKRKTQKQIMAQRRRTVFVICLLSIIVAAILLGKIYLDNLDKNKKLNEELKKVQNEYLDELDYQSELDERERLSKTKDNN
ncbi:MAG: hypothetical protein MJ113_08030 [Lachnospiraceae bacterium]|nr:hypothetical protein [Lachnospiraceae bacterium]